MKQFRDTPYYVSKKGEVFRYWPERYVKNGYHWKTKKQKYLFRPEKWDKLGGLDADGYVIIDTCINGKRQAFKAHRMVAELYVDGYFEGAWIDHIDCNKQNNHPSNLQWCTPEYNRSKGNNPTYPLFLEVCNKQQ